MEKLKLYSSHLLVSGYNSILNNHNNLELELIRQLNTYVPSFSSILSVLYTTHVLLILPSHFFAQYY